MAIFLLDALWVGNRVGNQIYSIKKGSRENLETPDFIMEAASGFEPENNGFAGRCLTPWRSRLVLWSGKRELNPRLRPWQGRTLPLSYSRSAKSSFYLL